MPAPLLYCACLQGRSRKSTTQFHFFVALVSQQHGPIRLRVDDPHGGGIGGGQVYIVGDDPAVKVRQAVNLAGPHGQAQQRFDQRGGLLIDLELP